MFLWEIGIKGDDLLPHLARIFLITLHQVELTLTVIEVCILRLLLYGRIDDLQGFVIFFLIG